MLRNKFSRPAVPQTSRFESLIDPLILTPKPTKPQMWPTAPSLKPQVAMIEASARGEEEAIAIRNAWRSQHPIKVLSRAAYQELIARCGGVSFGD